MKAKSLLAAMLIIASGVSAQTVNDPTVMIINGKAVPRSEFEYSYNKNNSETVVDKKSVSDYVDLFVNYKLKVAAAEEAGIDTTKAFRDEFIGYRNQQVCPSFINDDDIENEARKIYNETKTRIDGNGGLFHVKHILVHLNQNATAAAQDSARLRADSIYTALQKGAEFEDLARRCSDDKGSARRGGDLSWIQKGQTVPDFEKVVLALKKGETSKPFLSPFGYHIAKLIDQQGFFPYDSVRADIKRFIDARGLRNKMIDDRIDSIAKAQSPAITPDEVIDRRTAEMTAADPSLRYLIQEYHDGLLLYEISNRNVWNKASVDEKSLEAYFKKNRKKYRWTEPRFKGITLNTKDEADIKAVKESLKKIPFEQWADSLRKQFNDSTIRIRVVKGMFKKGDNATIDKMEFHVDTTVVDIPDYPFVSTYGKMLKAPENYRDVRDLVVADYQEALEKQWIASLRKRYKVVLNQEALDTVNKH